MRNLEDYVLHIIDATINTGISRQAEAFRSGFNQVCTITLSFDEVGRILFL